MVKLQNLLNEKSKGLWHNIHAKRKRGEAPAKPGDEDYPKTLDIDEKVIKVSKKDDVPGNPMKMRGEEKIKKLVYSGSNGTGSYEIKGKNLNVIGIRPRDKGFFVRHFTNNTGFRKANLYYDGVQWQGDKKFESVNESDLGLTLKKGKTIKVTHEKSGKELVIIDKPNVRKEYEKIGYFAEGSCGYGIDGKVGSQPAGPHLIKKKKKKVDESVNERRQYKSGSQEMNFIVQQLVKYGNTKSDAIKMTQKHYNNVLKRYKEPWFIHPVKKAEIISSLSANESVNEVKKLSDKELVDYMLYIRKYKPGLWNHMKKNPDMKKMINKFKLERKKKKKGDDKWKGLGYDSFESVNEADPCWKGYKQVGMKDKDGKKVPNCVPEAYDIWNESTGVGYTLELTGGITEAEYQGRKVKLNKPTSGDNKKFKVYVNTGKKNKDGTIKVKKVEFGQKGARIKKSNPDRRSSFRARHNCENPGPKTKARYWSCKKW